MERTGVGKKREKKRLKAYCLQWKVQFYSLRLVFTSDGFRVGVAIRSVERSDSSDSVYDFVVYDQVKNGSSESQGEV